MKNRQTLTRRNMLKGSVGGAVALLSPAIAKSKPDSSAKCKTKTSFYRADGAFCQSSAKKAYYAMMKALGYPIPDVLKTDQFWVCDFLQRDFATVGLGGIFWTKAADVYGRSGTGAYSGEYKDKAFGYTGIEIFLLPGQMIPEHRHVGGAEGYGPKLETWLVRYGSVEFFGEVPAQGNETLIRDMAGQDRPWGHDASWFKCKYRTQRRAQSGQVYPLNDPESWHFMRAGSAGAIVTEFATCHNHVAFSKPGMAFENTPKF